MTFAVASGRFFVQSVASETCWTRSRTLKSHFLGFNQVALCLDDRYANRAGGGISFYLRNSLFIYEPAQSPSFIAFYFSFRILSIEWSVASRQ